jgi:ribosomal protein L40E
MIGIGLFIFRYTTEITNQLGGFISPPPTGGNITQSGYSEGYLPLVVYGFGFSALGIGGAMIRSAFVSSMIGGGGMEAAGLPSSDMMNAYMQRTMAASRGAVGQSAAELSTKEVVKIRCRNCGSLESEDAVYCRKCGQAL